MDEAYERMLNGAAAYKSMILIAGLECEHPPEFRAEPEFQQPVPFEHKRLDPFEWTCLVCGTTQVRKPERR